MESNEINLLSTPEKRKGENDSQKYKHAGKSTETHTDEQTGAEEVEEQQRRQEYEQVKIREETAMINMKMS